MTVLKRYIFIIGLVFVFGIISGFLTLALHPVAAQDFRESFSMSFSPLFDIPPWQAFLFIILNNSVKTFAAMLLGVLFGIAPAFFIYINGYVIGGFAYIVPDTAKFAASIIPHGIFEVPAVLLACALGLLFGAKLTGKLFRRESISLEKEILKGISFFAKVIIPMLIFAAFVEAYITPMVVRSFMQ